MAKIEVKNNLLYHKGISYQISQIISKKIVYIKPKINKSSLRSRLPRYRTWLAGVFVLVSLATLFFTIPLNLYFSIISVALILLSLLFTFRIVRYNASVDAYNERLKAQESKYAYGLSLRLPNGDDPLFVSSNLKQIRQVDDAIEAAMNREKNVNVSIIDSSIEIFDSSDITIGSVVADA